MSTFKLSDLKIVEPAPVIDDGKDIDELIEIYEAMLEQYGMNVVINSRNEVLLVAEYIQALKIKHTGNEHNIHVLCSVMD
ncbi:MAG: hypothetical protein ACRDBG_09865 [Waterburya sp.]